LANSQRKLKKIRQTSKNNYTPYSKHTSETTGTRQISKLKQD